MRRYPQIAAATAIVFAALLPQGAGASSFPPSSIRIVVPFAAGGPTDAFARFAGEALASKLKVPVVIDNRPGASGRTGSAEVARAKGDGSTLLVQATPHVINPAMYNDLPYDTEKDFVPLALISTIPNALVVNAEFPAKTVEEVIALARKDPGKLTLGSFGGANQLAGELFKQMAKIDIQMVPYKGSAPAMNDVVGGHISMMFDSLNTTIPLVRGGRVRAVGVTTLQRSPQLPDVPTISEAGLPGFDVVAWFGLFMPRSEAGVDEKLASVMAEVLTSPALAEKFRSLGAEPGTLTGPSFQKFVSAEIQRWGEVVRVSGIKPQ